MPLLQRRTSFNRKDIAKALFNLDISNNKLLIARKILKLRKSQIVLKLPLDAAKRNNTVSFLALLIEI